MNASHRRFGRPRLEGLEDRTVPTIVLPAPGEAGTVLMTGSDKDDQFLIATAPVLAPGNWLAFSDDGGQSYQIINAQYVTDVVVQGLGGNDTLQLDSSAGLLGGERPLSIGYDGGTGFDRLELVGDPGGPVAVENNRSGTDSGTVTFTDGYRSTVIAYKQVEAVLNFMPSEDESLSFRGK